MSVIATITSALVTSALALGVSAPADATRASFTDPQDTSHGSDLLRVDVRNGERTLKVVTTHVNLRRDPASGSGGAVYVDTDRSDRGPEFVLVGGYFVGTDYQLLHTEGFGHRQWGAPARGSYELRVDYTAETVTMRMSKRALDGAEDVRVAVRVAGTRSDGSSNGLVDWLGGRHHFTRTVPQG